MKFSEQWLRTLVDPSLTTDELAHRLTMIGHEVDAIDVHGESLDGVVVAEVVDVAPHPDADRLRVCQVAHGGKENANVVCGAPNVTLGMKSPFAPAGTRLPNGMKLRRAKIRGVESQGMLCSAVELGLGEESDGIIELAADALAGRALTDYLSLPDKSFDLDLTPNRGDCFSVLGIARDVAAATGTELKRPDVATIASSIDDRHPVELVLPAGCPRFAARVVRGIDAAARSPVWMTERLRRSGLRSIHPVVDVTNYVMLELGQPLHAYDCQRLNGPIRPRLAKKGEKLTLLDDRAIELLPNTLVITDDSGPIGLAGIMGGLSTAVTADTKDVFFEAAYWPAEFMAGRARQYGLHTDASLRFERGVDFELQVLAIERATGLLLDIAGGQAGPLDDHVSDADLPAQQSLELRNSRLRKVLGTDIPVQQVSEILTSLEMPPVVENDGWRIEIPSHRFDIDVEDSLVEEVARIYGYDEIPAHDAHVETPLAAAPELDPDLDAIAGTLVARDYQEVITYSFVDQKLDELLSGNESTLTLQNPISSDMTTMRATIMTGLLSTAATNLARQQDRVRLFEIGKTFHGTLQAPCEVNRLAAVITGNRLDEQWGERSQVSDFYDLKSDMIATLNCSGSLSEFSFHAADHPALQRGQSAVVKRDEQDVGYIGKLHPSVARKVGVKKDAFVFEIDIDAAFAASLPMAKTVSKFPAIRRDIAVVVDEKIKAADLQKVIEENAHEALVGVRIFDVYRGEGVEAGRKSVALGLILQETSRTLTDEDADTITSAVVRKLQQDLGAELRD